MLWRVKKIPGELADDFCGATAFLKLYVYFDKYMWLIHELNVLMDMR